jgi:hypothetical protein
VSPFWKRQSPPGAQELAQRLSELGLFEYLDSAEARRAEAAVASEGIEAVWRVELGRDVMAGDAEDLAEGGVGEFLEELSAHLSRRGVPLPDVEDIFNDERTLYQVKVGDQRHTIYDVEGSDADVATAAGGLWGLAWARAFDIVNGLLESAGSRERAYTLPESALWFLTPDQFDALRAATPNPRDRPYTPDTNPPWYGEDH